MSDRDWPDLRWCGGPPLFAREAMDDWLAMLGPRCPWDEMLPDDVSGEFRRVLEELLQPAEDLGPHQRALRLRYMAREHGAYRRRQGYHALILAEEISVAEDAITAAIVRSGCSPAELAAVRDSLAPVMRAIERAMYSGHADCGPPLE